MSTEKYGPKGIIFVMSSAIVLVTSLFLAFQLQRSTVSSEGGYTFYDFLNDGKSMPSMQDAIVGMVFGIVFGCMDTLGTWVGMQNITNAMPTGSPELRAAIAGMYSNIMGLTMGTLVTLMVRIRVGSTDQQKPIWLNVLGILLGSTLGVFIGKFFFS